VKFEEAASWLFEGPHGRCSSDLAFHRQVAVIGVAGLYHPGTRKGQQMATTFGLKPLEDRIAVLPSEEEQTTVSGIVIPDTAKEKPQEGEVMAVGPGRFEEGQRIPVDVKVGDKVVYSKYGGTEVKVEAEEYLILSARDVLAVISSERSAS
jgi:chaperonin GroES